MGVFDKMLSAMRLGDEDYDDYEDDDDDEDDEEESSKSIFKRPDNDSEKKSSGASISRFSTMAERRIIPPAWKYALLNLLLLKMPEK